MLFVMVTLQELTLYLEGLLKCNLFTDYGPNGLQVEGTQSITRIATAVSASVATIEKAIAQDVQALIVHHGMFWSKDPLPAVGTKRKKLELLIQNNISLLAYHLPLDAHQHYGNNWKAARDMGWEDLEPFAEIGVKGTFSTRSIETFQEELEDYYDHPAHFAPGASKEVSSAALVSGGAHRLYPEAAALRVDCYITGSFDEPNWYQASEEGTHFFAMGHAATEVIGPKALSTHLAEQFNLESQFLDLPNPF